MPRVKMPLQAVSNGCASLKNGDELMLFVYNAFGVLWVGCHLASVSPSVIGLLTRFPMGF
jgi:hypothetical protein